MSKLTRWSSLAGALGLSLVMATGAFAQGETDETAVVVPELEGLAWYRSDDLTGPEMEASLPQDEVADWATLLEGASATFEDLDYTYQSAFDPAALPDLGGMATVRVAGADTDALRTAVAGDIVLQVEKAGFTAPPVEPGTVGGKDVVIVRMPAEVGLEDAVIYASGDVAWAIVMAPELAAAALEQLP